MRNARLNLDNKVGIGRWVPERVFFTYIHTCLHWLLWYWTLMLLSAKVSSYVLNCPADEKDVAYITSRHPSSLSPFLRAHLYQSGTCPGKREHLFLAREDRAAPYYIIWQTLHARNIRISKWPNVWKEIPHTRSSMTLRIWSDIECDLSSLGSSEKTWKMGTSDVANSLVWEMSMGYF